MTNWQLKKKKTPLAKSVGTMKKIADMAIYVGC